MNPDNKIRITRNHLLIDVGATITGKPFHPQTSPSASAPATPTIHPSTAPSRHQTPSSTHNSPPIVASTPLHNAPNADCPYGGLPAAHLPLQHALLAGWLPEVPSPSRRLLLAACVVRMPRRRRNSSGSGNGNGSNATAERATSERGRYAGVLPGGWLLLYGSAVDLRPSACVPLQRGSGTEWLAIGADTGADAGAEKSPPPGSPADAPPVAARLRINWRTPAKQHTKLFQLAGRAERQRWLDAFERSAAAAEQTTPHFGAHRKLPTPPPAVEDEAEPPADGLGGELEVKMPLELLLTEEEEEDENDDDDAEDEDEDVSSALKGTVSIGNGGLHSSAASSVRDHTDGIAARAQLQQPRCPVPRRTVYYTNGGRSVAIQRDEIYEEPAECLLTAAPPSAAAAATAAAVASARRTVLIVDQEYDIPKPRALQRSVEPAQQQQQPAEPQQEAKVAEEAAVQRTTASRGTDVKGEVSGRKMSVKHMMQHLAIS